MTHSEFFMRIPHPNGTGWEFIPVDHTRADRSLLELWKRDPGGTRTGSRFISAMLSIGVGSTVNVSKNLEAFEDALSEVRNLLSATDETSHDIDALIFEKFELLKTLIDELGKGEIGAAQKTATTFIWDLYSAATQIVAMLNELENKATIAEAVSSSSETALQSVVVAEQSSHLTWAQAADDIAIIVEKIRELRHEITGFRTKNEGAIVRLDSDFNDDSPVVVSALEYFDGIEDSFIIDALNFCRRDPATITEAEVAQMRGKIQEAKEHIRKCQQFKIDALTIWSPIKIDLDAKMISWDKTLKELIESLRKARDIFKIKSDEFGSDAKKPHEIPALGVPITKEEFEAGEKLFHDPEWNPKRADTDTRELIEAVSHLVGSNPKDLPSRLNTLINQAEEKISRINRRHSETSSPPVPTAPCATPVSMPPDALSAQVADPIPRAATPTPQMPSTRPETAQPSPERIEVLHELAICVGLALSCSPFHFAHTSTPSIMSLILRLGKCSQHEASLLLDDLDRKMTANSQLLTTEKGNIEYWRTSRATWLKIEIDREPTNKKRLNPFHYKLTASSRPTAEQLLLKHCLTVEMIKKTKEERDTENRERFAEMRDR